MLSLDEKTIRAAFVNATRKELTELTLPDLTEINWDKLDYLGWRDRRLAKRAYIVVPADESEGGGLIGVVLKQAEANPRSRAQCSWCQDIHLPNDVVLFSAKRSGDGGRVGNSVGILICSEFECSANVRKAAPMAYIGYDVEAARLERIAVLKERAATFASEV